MKKTAWIWAMALLLATTGCRIGPPMLRLSREEYNQAVHRSNQEQILLNLVRLKYSEVPLFLDVSNISAQFRVEKGADLSGRLSGNPSADASLLGLAARFAYEERPTITYAPLQGDAYAERLMSPLTLDTVMLLYYSGWPIDTILRLAVQRINGVENAMRAAGPTPSKAPPYKGFLELAAGLKELQAQGKLDLGYELREVAVMDSIPADRILGADVVAAANGNFTIRKREGENAYAITRSQRVPVIRGQWTEDGTVTQEQREDMIARLGITPGLKQYDLKEAFSVPTPGQGARYDVLAMGMRSLIGILSYLSEGIEVPEQHVKEGLVQVTLDEQGKPFDWTLVTGDLLRVRSASDRPANASLAVRYRGYWFYIEENDLKSKATIMLVLQLFALQAGSGQASAPVLTLPLGD